MNDFSKRPMRSGVVRAIAAVATGGIGVAIFVLGSRYLGSGETRKERGRANLVVSAETHERRALTRAKKRNDEPLPAARWAHATKARKEDPRRVSRALGAALMFREGWEKNDASNLRITIESDAGPAPRRSVHLINEVVMGRTAELQRDLHSPKYEEFTYVPVNFLGVMQPLLDTAIEADRPRIAQMLIADGANVNYTGVVANATVMTPLQEAARADNKKSRSC